MIENNNKKPAVIVIIILILIILALGGYIALDKFVLNKKEEKVTTTIKDIEFDLNAMYQISNTLNKLDNTFNDINSNYLGYIYSKKKLIVKEFDPTAALFLALHDDLELTNLPQQIPEQQIKNNFESIFGQDLKYQANNIDAGNFYKIMYDVTTHNYLYTLNSTLRNQLGGYESHNVKTILESDAIIVTRKIFFVEYDATKTTVNIYRDSSKGQLLGTLKLRNGVLNTKEILGKYGSKMNNYDYTFKQNSSDNYTLYSIEKK